MTLKGLREDVPLAPLTSYRIGGTAKRFIEPESVEELLAALAWAGGEGLQAYLLGGGSNVLVDDGGVAGLVIRLAGEFRGIRLDGHSGEVVAGGGAPLSALALKALKAGHGEYLRFVGIPGTVGGAAVMNAGTARGDFAGLLKWAELLDPEGSLVRLPAGEMKYAYRTSLLKESRGWTLLRVGLALRGGGAPEPLLEERTALLAERRRREPANRKNCGSVFKNPPGAQSAGSLIERVGLKGHTVGGAMVALEHANWIVNTGSATAADVRALCSLVVQRVREAFGVELCRELIYLPQDLS